MEGGIWQVAFAFELFDKNKKIVVKGGMPEMLAEGKNVVPGSYASGELVAMEDPFASNEPLEGAIVHVLGEQKGDFIMPFLQAYRRGACGIVYNYVANDHGRPAATELGVPMVMGVPDAELRSAEGEVVTIKGDTIYEGHIEDDPSVRDTNALVLPSERKLMLTMGFPDSMKRHEELLQYVDGVAFVRLEFVILSLLRENRHPELVLQETENMDKALANELERIIQPFAAQGKDVYLRTDDFSRSDLHRMKGGAELEKPEANPALGVRGVRRYKSRPKLLQWQLRAIKILLEKGYENIGLFPPMVSLSSEFRDWKQQCSESLETLAENIKWGLMIETPSTVVLAERFRREIEFVVFGTNDLMQFTMGASRNDAELSYIFEEARDSLMEILKIALGKLEGVKTLLSGPLATDETFVTKLCRDHGLGGISLEPDDSTVARMRRVLYGLNS